MHKTGQPVITNPTAFPHQGGVSKPATRRPSDLPRKPKAQVAVALLASGVLLQVHRYGGPLADRDSDASTRSVAGGITPPPRGCIA